jgi:hypothetical protein
METERLLNAIRWFENVPMNQEPPDVSGGQMAKITEAAVAEAQRLGLGTVEERIEGLLAKLREETLAQRIDRLVTRVRQRFGVESVSEKLQEDCRLAARLRGRGAHTALSENVSFANLSRAVYAMECFSFLLMIHDLPLSAAAPSRLRHHPLMEYLHFRE